jgi:hypothetical protein
VLSTTSSIVGIVIIQIREQTASCPECSTPVPESGYTRDVLQTVSDRQAGGEAGADAVEERYGRHRDSPVELARAVGIF